MEKPNTSGEKPVKKEKHFSNKTTIKLSDDDVSKMYDDASEKNIGEYGEVSERG